MVCLDVLPVRTRLYPALQRHSRLCRHHHRNFCHCHETLFTAEECPTTCKRRHLYRVQGLSALAEALSLASHIKSLLLWGNSFGPVSSRAFLDTLASMEDSQPVIDIKPYAVDGVAQVALVEERASA